MEMTRDYEAYITQEVENLRSNIVKGNTTERQLKIYIGAFLDGLLDRVPQKVSERFDVTEGYFIADLTLRLYQALDGQFSKHLIAPTES